ncbi:hypothetical protein [Clostridium saudiense]|uniref:hypothetical protein n=1 Tax=Clostridium saudiense TaxID=1414720 RepID=UPI0018ABF533|nr:hypothetical protein [Clostridium saudiense]
MELNLKGKHIFSIARLISKMNVKKEIKDFFKAYTNNAKKKTNATLKLRLALGDLEATAKNVEKVCLENKELDKELSEVQEQQQDLILDIAFFILEKASNGEEEIFKILADMYGVSYEEYKELGFNEMLESIFKVIKNEEIQQGFLSIFK